MTDAGFEERLAEGLRALANDRQRPYDAAALSQASVRPRRWSITRLLGSTDAAGSIRGSRLRNAIVGVAAVAVVAVIAAGLLAGPILTQRPSFGGPVSPAPVAPVGSTAPSATPASSIGVTGRIAFVRDDHLWISALDGTGPILIDVQVPRDGLDSITWDPVGDRLATLGPAGGGRDGRVLAIFDRVGRRVRSVQLPDSTGQVDISWAPDGTRLAAMGIGADGLAYLHIVGVDPADDRVLTLPDLLSFEYEEHSMAWSPDGGLIAFTGCQGCNYRKADTGDLWLIQPDGSGLRRLTAGSYDYAPAWVGGDRIAFARDQLGAQWLMTAAVDGSDLRRVDDPHPPTGFDESWNTGIKVAPDLTSLASAPRGTSTLKFVDPTGRTSDREFRQDVGLTGPDVPTVRLVGWMPDGTSVLTYDANGLYRVDVAGGLASRWPVDLWRPGGAVGPLDVTFDP